MPLHYCWWSAGRLAWPDGRDARRSTYDLPLVPGDDRGLDIPVAVQHVAEHIVQTRKGRFAGNVVGATNFLLGNQTKGPAHRLRGVVESRFQSDFRVMQAVGVQLHLGSRSAPAEEIHRAALANHLHSPLPRLRAAYGFDCHIRAAPLRT